jgi:hypothetical protein
VLTAEQDAVKPYRGVPEGGGREDHGQVEGGERLGVQQFPEEGQVQPGELQAQGGGDGDGQHGVGQGAGPGPGAEGQRNSCPSG